MEHLGDLIQAAINTKFNDEDTGRRAARTLAVVGPVVYSGKLWTGGLGPDGTEWDITEDVEPFMKQTPDYDAESGYTYIRHTRDERPDLELARDYGYRLASDFPVVSMG